MLDPHKHNRLIDDLLAAVGFGQSITLEGVLSNIIMLLAIAYGVYRVLDMRNRSIISNHQKNEITKK